MISWCASGRTSVLRLAPGEDPVSIEERRTVGLIMIHRSSNSTGRTILGVVRSGVLTIGGTPRLVMLRPRTSVACPSLSQP